jgi:outer membrane protein assembly factor BamE (lipoprotein component of BamABCDE complex)
MRQSFLAACLAVLILGGCATGNWQEGVRPWWTLNEGDIAAVTRDQTKAEVERRLGKPLLVERFSRLREEVWNYRFLEGRVRRFAAEVHFDLEGKTTYVATYRDNCTFGPVGCR